MDAYTHYKNKKKKIEQKEKKWKEKREKKCYYRRLPYDRNKEHHYYTDGDGR